MTHLLVFLRFYIFQCRITQGHKTLFAFNIRTFGVLCIAYIMLVTLKSNLNTS